MNANDFTLIRFNAASFPRHAKTLIDAVTAGDVPASLKGAFQVSSDVQWVAPATYERVEIVTLASLRDAFIVENDQVDSVIAWLDSAITGWRAIDNGYGFPSITVRPLARDPEFLGQQMTEWLGAAERQSEVEGRM